LKWRRLLRQMLRSIPVSPKIAAYSITVLQGGGPAEHGDDGVVSYQSAQIKETASELILRSGYSDPRIVAKVRRVLPLHLASACPTGCAPVAPPVARAGRQ
jgi:hypothetical protein